MPDDVKACYNCGFEIKEGEGQCPHCGADLAAESHHTRIDTSAIRPQGTGCRACIILLLLVGAVFGFIYFYYMNRPPAQTPSPAQPQGYQGQGISP